MHRRNLSLASVAVLMGMAIPIGAARALEQGPLAGAGLRSRQPATRPLTASPRASSRPAAALAPMPVDTPRPSATRALAPASTPVPPPTRYLAHFDTLAAGSALPSDAQCASEIATNPWEPRPQNLTANQTNVYAQGFRLQNSYLGVWAPEYESLVTGNSVGTTDQILPR